MSYLYCTSNFEKWFMYFISFDPHKNLMNQELFLSPIYRWENWDWVRLNDTPSILHLLNVWVLLNLGLYDSQFKTLPAMLLLSKGDVSGSQSAVKKKSKYRKIFIKYLLFCKSVLNALQILFHLILTITVGGRCYYYHLFFYSWGNWFRQVKWPNQGHQE